MPRILAVCGVLLLLAGQLTAQIGYDDRAAEVRALRAGGGVETVGIAVSTFERERTQRTRRSTRTHTVTCGEYRYRAAGQRHTHREYDQCGDVEVGDRLALIYDADRPSRVFNNDDAHVESLDRRSGLTWWLRFGGGLLVLPLVVSVVRRRFAA